MIVSHVKDVEGIKVCAPGSCGAVKKVLISPSEGWEGYVMRVFDIGTGGNTPKHTHDWPHINYVLEGSGTLYLDGTNHEIKKGSFAYVPGGKEHSFINTGSEKLSIICIVPEEGDV
jgi:quercetin dioxygenase-like cupin family protein